MIVKFTLYNESIRDKMTPRSEDDIRTDIEKDSSPNQFLKACELGYLDIVKKTLPDVKESQNYYSLVWQGQKRSVYSGHLNILKYLVDNTRISYLNYNDDELLRRASERGYTDIVEYLLSKGCNIHVRDDEPLWNAIYYGHVDCAKFLLKHGAYLDDKFIREDNSPEMKEFLDSYINANESLRDKMTPKSHSIIRKQLDKLPTIVILSKIKKMGLDINDMYTDGEIEELNKKIDSDFESDKKYMLMSMKKVNDTYKGELKEFDKEDEYQVEIEIRGNILVYIRKFKYKPTFECGYDLVPIGKTKRNISDWMDDVEYIDDCIHEIINWLEHHYTSTKLK